MLNPDAMTEIFGDQWLEAAIAMTEQHIQNKRDRAQQGKVGQKKAPRRT
jgi:hypothetical protein